MQSGGPGDIRHRIGMEGGEEFKKQLLDLGQAGEQAFDKIRQASEASGSRLGNLSSVVSGVRNTFASVATAVQPVIHQFGHVQESVRGFGEALTNVGERIFPHFKEAVAIGTAAGIAGLVEFAVSGAKAAKEIGDMSRALGMSTDRFQGYKAAAAAAGIEGDRFVQMLTRFAAKASEAANSQLQDLGGLAKLLVGDVSTMGTEVLRGTQKTADGVISTVLRGGQGAASAVGRGLYAIDSRVSTSIQKGTELGKYLGELGGVLEVMLKKAGVETHKTGTQIAQDLMNVAASGTAAGKTSRDFIASLGGSALIPAQTAFEAIDRYTKSWQQNLKDVVFMWKKEGKDFVPKSMEQAFGELADKVKALGGGMQALSLVRANFGRDSVRMSEVLSKGNLGIEQMITDFTHLGIAIAPAETEVGSKLVIAFEHLEHAIMNVRTAIAVGLGESFEPVIEAFTHAIGANMNSIREWAATIAVKLTPGMKELAHWIEGATDASHIQTQWVRTLIGAWNDAKQVITFVAGAFSAIVTAMDYVAAGVNALFNTSFTGGSLLAILAIGKVTGAFTLLTAATNIALDLFMLFVTKPLVMLIELAAKAGLIRAAITGISAAFSMTGAGFAAAFVPILAAIGPVGWIILGIAAIAALIITWKGSWGDVFTFLTEGFNNLYGTVSAFIDLVKSAIAAVGRLLAAGGGTAANPSGSMMAAGGPVRGPGGIDNVPIRATAGEYMMRTAAVSYYGMDLMHAINSLRMPAPTVRTPGPVASLPAPSVRFALGGAVTAMGGGDRSAIHLHIGGDEFVMETDRATAGRVVRAASEERILSAGPKREWYGGR